MTRRPMRTPPGSPLLFRLAAPSSQSPPCFARHMDCTPARSGSSPGGHRLEQDCCRVHCV
eukprot:6808311-Prymnesium_polylepis.1